MTRWLLLVLSLGMVCRGWSAAPPLPPATERGLKICVAADAPAPVRQAAAGLLQVVGTHPLLKVLAGAHAPVALTDSAALLAAKPEERAWDHLVVVGLATDPLLQAGWQREARFTADGIYVFGFGYLRGDVGYIESDRNPLLHAAAIPQAPYETEFISLTGTSPAGVALAVAAFQKGLVNGVVAAPGWTRPRANLLQRDPLPSDFRLPSWVPDQFWGGLVRIGWTQAGEDEYRGVLRDAKVMPVEIWRVKYYRPGVWDGVGAVAAVDAYAAGLHRRATALTLWLARFVSEEEAGQALPLIGAATGLQRGPVVWTGPQPAYGYGTSPGTLTLWQRRDCLLMSTLPGVTSTDIP